MIPIYKPFLKGNEIKYVNDCLESTWISSRGSYIDKFEDAVKDYVGCKFVSSCSNGTTALDLVFKALGIGAGDEVITSNFTYVASTNAILVNGAKPVFVDIETDTWNIDPDLIESKITPNTKAIMIANIYGVMPNLDKLNKICCDHNIYLIEDAAESLGADYKGVKSGNVGLISTFSFFGNKTITTGEGGMVLTNDKSLFDKVEVLKNQGNSKTQKYYHDVLGFNYRMTNIQAAIGLAQMEQIDKILDLKARIFNYYLDNLGPNIIRQKTLKQSVSSYWIVTALFENSEVKEKVMRELEKNDIETRPLFFPIDELPFYEKEEGKFISKEIYNRGICLPSFPGLKTEELDIIIQTIKRCVYE